MVDFSTEQVTRAESCPWGRMAQFDRTNNGVRTFHGLKANGDGSSGRSQILLPLAQFRLSGQNIHWRNVTVVATMPNHGHQGWRYHSDLSASHPMAFNGRNVQASGAALHVTHA